MRSILFIVTFAIFSKLADFSGAPKAKRDREPGNLSIDGAERERIIVDVTEEAEVPPRKKARSPRFISGGTSVDNAEIKEELLALLNSRRNAVFKSKVDAIGVSRMPADIAHELMITCMLNKNGVNLKHMLNSGYRFAFSDETRENDVIAFIQAILDDKVDFLGLFLDVDPVGATSLLVAAFNTSPHSKVLEKLKNCLKKNGAAIDSGAIQLAAETAADLHSIAIFNVIFESKLMISMIPGTKLLHLFADNDCQSFRKLFISIINERELSLPYEMNLLSQAAAEGNMKFLLTIEPYLNNFSWDVVLQAISIALKKEDYNFVDVLLRTNTYSKPDFLFRLVPELVFVDLVGKFANYEIIDKLTKATCHEGMNLVIADLNLMRICMRAAAHGNIEVIDYFLGNDYFDLSTRFKGKSIFRIALENGQSDLVMFLINVYGYSIYDSDTPTVNPSQNGGDSLIYTARNSHAHLFLYLLRLGANPNVKVYYNGRLMNLINWCKINGQDEIVKHLMEFKCELMEEIDI